MKIVPLVLLIAVSAAFMIAIAGEENRAVGRVIGATAVCVNGKISTAPRGVPGACSSHGGVQRWIYK